MFFSLYDTCCDGWTRRLTDHCIGISTDVEAVFKFVLRKRATGLILRAKPTLPPSPFFRLAAIAPCGAWS